MAWTIGGWAVGLVGVAVVLWALLWDRARGRLRCRKCWYALDGVDASDDGAVTCPECGRVHRTRRAMLRTRRRWRWVWVALVLLVVSHGLRVAPDVRRNGWIEAVPDVVLVASYPFLSEEPGSGMPLFLPNKQGGWYERGVLRRTGVEGWSRENHEQRFSWLSRRLVFLIARTQGEAELTDGTTAKGKAFKSTLTQIVRSGGAYGFESRWAHSVACVEFDGPGSVAPGERLYASPRVRRLLLGAYRLRVNGYDAELQGQTPSSMWVNGAWPAGTAAEAQWIERFRWDRLSPAHGSDPVWTEGTRLAMSSSAPQADGAFEREAELLIAEDEALWGETERWRRVAKIRAALSGEVDSKLTPTIDSSTELRDELESGLRARLAPVYDSSRARWVLAVRLEPKRAGKGPPVGKRLVFGGRCSVVVSWNLDGEAYEPTAMWGNEALWLWVTPDPGTEENPYPTIDLELSVRRGWLPPQSGTTAGEVTMNGSPPASFSNHSSTVYAVISGRQMVMTSDLMGVRADTVYDGELRFRLDWTAEELRRFLYLGEIPEHAMR